MNNNNKKRLFIAAIFLLLLFLLMTFAGGNTEVAVVEFIDGFDDSVIDTQQVEIGEDAKVPEDPKHKNFVFAGWYLFSDHDVKVTDFTNIEEDLKVIALYAGDRNNNGIDDDKDEVYTVTFIDGFNDSVIKTEDVLVGMDAQAPEAPTHRGYTFIGWDKGYTNITVDTEVTAEYNRNEVQVTTYTVTFIDGETNEVITTQNVREGNTATLPTPPVHENRVFVSWKGEYTNVNSNRTITATYTDDKNNNGIEDETEAHYDITYVDYNDEILEVIEDVLVDTLTPTIEDPQRENYEFKGWEPSVSEYVTGNATYKAEYTPINDENNNNVADEEEEHYTIIYNDYDGKLIQKFENVLVDTETPTVENPTREYYTFEKWNPEIAELVKEDATYVASYTINNDVDNDGVPDETENKYTVNYYLISENDQTAYKTFTDLVEGVETPIVEKPTREFYEFVKWNPEVAETVTKDINYVAQWDAKNDEDNDNIADEEEFKIEFIVDNQVVKTEYLLEGEMPTAPTVEDTNEDNRVFAGWDSEIVSATEDKQYIAQFKEDLDNDGYADENQYKVEFVLDGEVLDTQYLNEDELPQVPIVPQEIYPEKKVFDKWTPEIVANYEGQYIGTWTDDLNENGKADKDETKFTITYLNKDGSEFAKFENQLEGLATPQPENKPVAEGFVFDGWDGVKPTIEGNATYESKWLVDSDKDGIADEDEFKIEFIVDREVVKTEYLTEGQNPTAPTVTDTNQDNRVFVKWNPEIVAATENAQYTAEFAEDLNNNGEADKDETKYTIKYLNKDGSVFKEFNNQLKGLATPQPENNPVSEGFVFDGWKDVAATITGNAEYASKWLVDSDKDGIADETEVKVEFYVDNKVVKTEYLTPGQKPTAPEVKDTDKDNRVFTGWTPEITEVKEGDKTVKYEATFEEDLNNNGEADKEEEKFTIIYLNKDGSEFAKFENQLKGLATPQPENNPTAEGFVFNGWKDVAATIKGNAEYVSKWLVDSDKDGIADEDEFKIEFIVDREVVKTEYLTEGQNPTAPTVTDTNEDNRVFAGWEPSIAPATKNTQYIAQFETDSDNDGKADKDQLLVEFVANNKTILSDYVTKGEKTPMPSNNDIPAVEGKAFYAWNPEVAETVEAAVVYTALYGDDTDNDGKADLTEIKIEFVVDQKVIKTEYLAEGEMPTAPTVTDTNEDNRVFVGWDKEIVVATEDTQYTAVFKQDTNNDGYADEDQFLIEFYNKDKFVSSNYYNEGATVVAPTLIDTNKDGEVHTGWTPEFNSTATSSVRYDAVWEKDIDNDGVADEDQLLVQFVANNQTILSDYVTKGEPTPMPAPTKIPTVAGKAFYAWEPEVAETVEAAVVYTALYGDDTDNDGKADITENKIEFKINGELVETQYLNLNEMPVAPTPTKEGYVLSDWTPTIEKVSGPQVYNATWLVDSNNDGYADEDQLLIEFYSKDEFVSSNYYNEGDEVVAPTLEDTKEDGETHTGWTPEFNSTATASVRYDAVWETDTDNDNIADEEEIKIEFVVDQKVVKTEYLVKGEMPTAPTVTDTNNDNRVFVGWDKEIVVATEDTQYTAVFKEDTNNDGYADEDQFLIEFYNKDKFVSSNYYNEGATVVAPILTDTNDDGKVHTGWTPEFNSTATASVRYDAVWKTDSDNDGYADEEQYKVEFVVEGTTISTQYLNKDEMPEVPTVAENLYPEKKVFDKWTPEVTANYEGQYTAIWTDDLNEDGIADRDQILWTVKFYGSDNTTIINEQLVVDGESAIAPTPQTVEGYEFVKWIQDYSVVKSNIDVYAEYKDIEAPTITSTVTLYNQKDGEYYNANIKFETSDNVGVIEVKYYVGKIDETKYNSATTIENKEINGISKNGIYTLFAKDAAGNIGIHYVEVSGISLTEGEFEDLYAKYELGQRTNGWIDGNNKYSQKMTITPLKGINIVDARIYEDSGFFGLAPSYANLSDFTSNVDSNGKSTFGKALSYEGNKIDYMLESYVTSRFTIYVKYEYKVEVAPGVYETRYETKLYKVRLAKYLQQ